MLKAHNHSSEKPSELCSIVTKIKSFKVELKKILFRFMKTSTVKLKLDSNYGFSLVELVITLALAAAMLTVGIPAFNNVMENNSLATTANRFISSIALARSEAVTRNIEVVMCRLNTAGTACATTGTWSDGWIIWADSDGDGLIENVNQDGEVEVVAQEEQLEDGYTIVALNNQYDDTITFNPMGEASGDGGSQQEIFRLCDPDNDNDRTRLIYLSGVGNAWVNRNAGSTSALTDC